MTTSTQARPRPSTPPASGPGPGVLTVVAAGLAALGATLGALALAGAVGPVGWLVGSLCGVVVCAAVVRGVGRAGRHHLLPADLVTLTRVLLACAAAGVVADALPAPPPTAAFLAVVVPALALDAVDGRVARRTRSATAFGARFDGESDAFLVLVLSVAAVPVVGWWVLAAGLARYVFWSTGALLAWMRRPLPPRHWRKVVAASVGVGLAAVAADLLPRPLAAGVAVAVLVLLAESFGHDVWWLWRRRAAAPRPTRGRRHRVGQVGRLLAYGTTAVLGWFALLSPTRTDLVTPGTFLRLPLEALVLVALTVALRGRARLAASVVAGLGLGAVVVVKALDLGMVEVRDRPFDLLEDGGALGSALSVVDDTSGWWAAAAAVAGALLLVTAALVGLPWALARLARALSGHRRRTGVVLVPLAVVWVLAATTGVRATGQPVAAAAVVPYVASKVSATSEGLRDRARFDAAIAADTFRGPGSADLAVLRGKDVLVVFVESYGRVALEGPQAEPVRQLLDDGTARLARSGFTARSAYLTSPAFGSGSWLAHSTLQSGLRVDGQWRYDRLLGSDRATLSSAFAREGWRTVAVLPSTRGPWPEGASFYRFDRVYTASDLGYAGPSFGFSTMPDQYALAELQRLELTGAPRRPVMAEVVLTSSHWPWAPLPRTVDRAALGDGAVFDDIEAGARTTADLWSDRSAVPGAYRTSIAYSLTSVLDLVAAGRDDDLVVLLLGDHQPSTVVTGPGASHDVPVTLIARDPAVVDAVAGWGWQPGLRPGDDAPVQPMESVRDRFLSTFSDTGGPVG